MINGRIDILHKKYTHKIFKEIFLYINSELHKKKFISGFLIGSKKRSNSILKIKFKQDFLKDIKQYDSIMNTNNESNITVFEQQSIKMSVFKRIVCSET